ncbi:MAG TPA: SDR family oxidoreductase [Solirubrobacteraceae bacterium]|jgi:thioester reductase-like protein/NADP-dependent 3-hydroxy acid dehydrogenase YdfG|nr:SDR family oxidoreductase [Solirubrobacteraceae bacterium]
MAYLITGATGFIGRHLVERLLANRPGKLYVLVRESSTGRLEELTQRWARATGTAAGKRIVPVVGDLRRPLLGLDQEQIAELRGKVEHFVHVAAIYDMTAPAERNAAANVGGTTHAVELARSLEVGCLHHVSSIAVAGTYNGTFSEEMFDEGQKLPSPYHRTKLEAERIVREQPFVPWRVYRPAIVVGDSRTGEMDKVDGPYYFFKAIQRARQLLPEWLPLLGVDLGRTNVVPVDWVAGAMEHLMHVSDLDGQAFHLTDPRGQRVDELINELASAAHAPRFAVSLDKRLTRAIPTWPLKLTLELPPWRQLRAIALRELGIPEEVLAHMELVPRFDTRATQLALAGSGCEQPPALHTYAQRLWDYWEREMDPDISKDRTLQEAVKDRRILITGASSGIGKATALKVAAAGGVPLLVARNVEKLEEVRAEIVAAGGQAYVYAGDMSDMASVDDLVERVLVDHRHVDMLVNNAGRSIRRSIALSYDRFHDFERTMQLNYFGAIRLILGLLPDMRERGSGHIVNISSIGVQTNPPRFSAYVASKAALDAFTRVVASETIGDGVTFTTIHMPLVRTPMIAPTKMYDAFPAITPDEAADMICEALRRRPKHMGTRLGTAGEVAYALSPKAVDRILHLAYRVFPDSGAARGHHDAEERASFEQIAMATLTRGVHW